MSSIEQFVINHAGILLPALLLLANFIYEFAIDQEVTIANFFDSALQLPAGIMFLSLSFFASFAIAPKGDALLGSLLLCFFLIFSILNILLLKKAKKQFALGRFYRCSFVSLFNLAVAAMVLSYSISKLKELAA